MQVVRLVYKLIEVIGRSDKSFAEAAKNAVEVASQTVKEMRWVEVEKLGVVVKDGEVAEYQARVKIAFEVIRGS